MMRINLRQTKPMKRYLVYTTDDLRAGPFDATHYFVPTPHENRYLTAPVEKVGLARLAHENLAHENLAHENLAHENLAHENEAGGASIDRITAFVRKNLSRMRPPHGFHATAHVASTCRNG